MKNLKTSYSEIVDIQSIGEKDNSKNTNEIWQMAEKENLRPSYKDSNKNIVIAIDYQLDFMEKGALGVPNSHKDIENATRFIYDNLESISEIIPSLDTHNPIQIFHPVWWVDENGNNPNPFTPITFEDISNGKWKAAFYPEESLEYVKAIEGLLDGTQKNDKKTLVIWPYHCIQGTVGASLENQFSNMVYFHAIAKRRICNPIVKGKYPLSEMYGIIKPEYDRKNTFNLELLNKIENADKVIIMGEAKSHCVLESIKQMVEHYHDRPDITSKLYILEDTMSSIPSFEIETEKAFEFFKSQYKINIVKSVDLIL